MIAIPYADILKRIQEHSQLSPEDIEQKIKAKLEQLSGLISREGAAHIVANELGVKIFDTSGKAKVANLYPGMRDVEIAAKVVATYEVRTFTSQRGEGKVGSCLVGDESGLIRMVFWGGNADLVTKMEPDMIIKVVGAYVKDNNGRKEVHLNDRSQVQLNPNGVTIGEVPKGNGNQQAAPRKKLQDISEQDNYVEVFGTLRQVFDPRFYEICNSCGKRARMQDGEFRCAQHGAVQPDYGYVLNFILDDGTGNMRVACFREQVEQVTGQSKDNLLKVKDEPQAFEEVKLSLLGEQLKIKARVSKNQMFDRLELVASNIVIVDDPSEEIARLEA